jgi:aryl-alcohol dehydrogenase-like predicted oxidoreductase
VISKRPLGRSGLHLSCLALGGHEYHGDGRLKGIGDDLQASIRPGFTMAGFGGPGRQALVARALELGITYFDATIDPEVEALGRNLGGADVLTQCRPQGMCYRYDPGNPALADLPRLRGEVQRLRALLGRPRVDVLNFGIEAEALGDPGYLGRVADAIAALKAEGLIRFAACDSLHSGEDVYLRLMRAGCFDVVWLNFGPLCPFPEEQLLPAARELGLGVAAREAFAKGTLFRTAPGRDRVRLAQAAIRWVLAHADVSSLAVGVRNGAELDAAAAAAAAPLAGADQALLDELARSPDFAAERERQRAAFRPR